MTAQDFEPPILVGGGAVELYSNSAVTTGDFDLVTARQESLEHIFRSLGFVRPSGPGIATRGWMHPDLKLGFEIVSSTLLDGLADRDRILLVDLGADGIAAIIAVEDMIADRMGQFASGSAPEMREQARRLLTLHSDADRAYLDRRIREETAGEYGIEDL
ncbi:hypothetical protein RZN05_00340 [Sphingomonas sp. HF-S4]|uniref:Uncharacterized protein n=1 Tax=Sphingomonas agrestis TaxID=3080540 RepID=A0ABU3Y213_9SPHN|nr:hypothetical protein [Sphingomonas sp. HF-S4]MDV3455413.1 hypothetical protein [Sphingomonas sp. HF-S4]